MILRNLPGGVPEPDELIGREHIISVLWGQLAANNILIVAPRRFGKTGIMRHVLKRPQAGYLPVYLDVEDISAPEGFVTELLAALFEHDRLRKFVTSIRGLPTSVLDFITKHVDELGPEQFRVRLKESLGEVWQTTARRMILEMEKMDETVVFIIDEFAEMVDKVSRAKGQGSDAAIEVVAWFRRLRLRQKDELRRYRFIIAGSTSIDMTLRRLGIPDKLNDCFRLPIEPLEPEYARVLLEGLAQSYGLQFTKAARDQFFELIGPPVPYFIHLFVSQLILEPGLKGKMLTPEQVGEVYRKRLLGPTCHKYFDPYRQRLRRYGPAAERAAVAILRAIAAAPAGRASDTTLYAVYRKARRKGATETEFREIMADLECDWYVLLDTATNEYYFLMDIMKAWWNRFYPRLDAGRK